MWRSCNCGRRDKFGGVDCCGTSGSGTDLTGYATETYVQTYVNSVDRLDDSRFLHLVDDFLVSATSAAMWTFNGGGGDGTADLTTLDPKQLRLYSGTNSGQPASAQWNGTPAIQKRVDDNTIVEWRANCTNPLNKGLVLMGLWSAAGDIDAISYPNTFSTGDNFNLYCTYSDGRTPFRKTFDIPVLADDGFHYWRMLYTEGELIVYHKTKASDAWISVLTKAKADLCLDPTLFSAEVHANAAGESKIMMIDYASLWQSRD